jgi:4-amino-4-deoxy-L-arabinose transferase-like glycosyltransferase
VRRVPWIALALVAVLAIALRFARLYWGLDRSLWFFDETVWAVRLRPFDQLSWKSFDTTGLGYPTLYQFVGGLGMRALGRSLHGAEAIGYMRTLAAIASVLAVLVTARLGTVMYGVRVGVTSAAFLAVAPLDAMQVHYASVEPFLVLGTTLTMLASWRLARRGTLGDCAAAGIAVGLTTAAKYPGIAFVAPVLWAIVERWWEERRLDTTLRRAAVVVVALVVSFAVACPPCIIHADVVLEKLYLHRQMAAFAGFDAACLAPRLGWWQRPWIYEIVASLPYGLGLPLAIVGMIGIAAALRRRTAADRLLLATVVPYFAYMGASSVIFPRYMLPLFPGLAIAAAAVLAHSARRRTATIVAGLIVAYGFALTVSQLRRFSWDQQVAVAEWLGDRVAAIAPKDREVAIPGGIESDPYFNLRTPLLAKGFRVQIDRERAWAMKRPAFFALPEWQSMAVDRDRRDSLKEMRMAQIQNGQAGYRPVLRVPIPDYLQRVWDERWDPTLAIELWQGSIGWTVYARNDVLPEVRTPEVLPAFPTPRTDPAPVAASPSPG